MKGRFAFPATSRLRSHKEFQRTWKEGTRYHTAHFIVVIRKNELNRPRLGITVNRKVGNSVCRNQLKRWLREYFRNQLKPLNLCLDFSLVAKRKAGSLTHDNIVQELNKVLARLETDYQC